MVKSNLYKENRIGRFSINCNCIEDGWDLSCVFSRMVIIRAESLYHMRRIEYVAYSDLFDILSGGLEPPYYRIVMEDGKVIAKKDREQSYIDRRLDAIMADYSVGYKEEHII